MRRACRPALVRPAVADHGGGAHAHAQADAIADDPSHAATDAAAHAQPDVDANRQPDPNRQSDDAAPGHRAPHADT
jgi:hypothetical protein